MYSLFDADAVRGLLEWLERNGASLSISVMTIAEMDSSVLKLEA